MRDWLLSLSQRERIMVLSCGVVVVAAVLWFGIWVPLDSRHDALRNSVVDWEAGLDKLQRVAELRGTGGPGPEQRIDTRPPLVIVDTSARARGLSDSIQRSQPTTSTGIRVEFENVAADTLVLWLGDLSTRHGLDVQQASLTVAPRAEPGRINATVTLERRQ